MNKKEDKTDAEQLIPKEVILEARVVTGAGGGPDKTILNTPRFMDPCGYKTLCAYMYPPEDPGFTIIQRRAEKLGCSLIGVPDRGMLDFRTVCHMIRLCRENHVTIWHGHDYKSNVLGLLIRRFHKMKLVTTVHGWVHHTWRTPLYYLLDRWCLRYYDHVICVSSDLYEKCLKCHVKNARCSLISNAVDAGQFSRKEPSSVAKKKLGLCEDRITLGAVGRLAAEKNFSGLIRSIGHLLDQNLPLELFIAGDGPEKVALEQAVAATGHAEHIHLLGFYENLHELYSSMDMFILNSFREGLPNVLLEAMAYEVPVISTRVAGVPNLIANGYNGILIDIGNESQLERSIKMLVEDNDYRAMIAHNACATIKNEYDLEKRMQKVIDIYKNLRG